MGPIAMRDAKRHMQALNELLQSCSCLTCMPDLQLRECMLSIRALQEHPPHTDRTMTADQGPRKTFLVMDLIQNLIHVS